ncbi:hypothetical protein SANTM175S_03257 [Streptomyces antimycoticus]
MADVLLILWRDIFVTGREMGPFLGQVIVEPFFMLFVFGKVLGEIGFSCAAGSLSRFLLAVETNDDQAVGSNMSAGPCGSLLSRTGTTPREATRLAAISMHWPPLSLYEDLNQRGDSVVTGCPFATG